MAVFFLKLNDHNEAFGFILKNYLLDIASVFQKLFVKEVPEKIPVDRWSKEYAHKKFHEENN